MKAIDRVLSIYPGWRVLGGSFLCAAMALGFTVYVFGLFVVPVSEEFGLSRANANNGMIALQLGSVVMAPFVGRLMDRFSARHIMMMGGVAFGGALMLASGTNSPWFMLFLLTVPLTFGYAACGVLGANTVVVRWFSKRRGRALGTLALSTSVGGMLSQPLTAFLIETFGWRTALFQIGFHSRVSVDGHPGHPVPPGLNVATGMNSPILQLPPSTTRSRVDCGAIRSCSAIAISGCYPSESA